MKNLFLIISFLFLISCREGFEKKKYHGKCVQKYISEHSHKNNIRTEPIVVFYSDSLKRNIAVENVSWNSYVNITVEKEVSFTLTDREINQ